MKPNTLIVGGPKTGTTSMRIYLDRHPDIFMSKREIHFFDEHYGKGKVWYQNQFDHVDCKIVGEKTPAYFYFNNNKLPGLVHSFNPFMKLLFTFRNPVGRAWSHHLMHKFNGYCDRELHRGVTFREILGYESNGGVMDYNLQYLNAGCYAKNLKGWLKFFPRDQMHFTILETLDQNEMNNICKFLGVKDFDFGVLQKYNIGGGSRSSFLSWCIGLLPESFKVKPSILRGVNLKRGSYPNMKDDDKMFLTKYYEKPNRELEKLIDIKLDVWRKEI